MDNCLFCKLVKGEVPSTKLFENEKVIGFADINPQAKVHALFIHKDHTKDLNELMDINPTQLSDIFSAVGEWTKSNLSENSYRVVNNCGEKAGQTVFHTHFHVLSDDKTLGSFGL